jgi:hypothetical protein
MRALNRLSLVLLLISASPLYANKFSLEINDNGLSIKERERHQPYHWEAYRGMMPRNAVVGGQEGGRILYICQSPYMGGMHPGKLVDGRCNITYAGREIPQTSFRILVGKGVHWMRSYSGEMAAGMVQGGDEKGRPLFICQAKIGRNMHPGKVVEDHCNVGFAGREVEKMDYRVLVSGNYRPHPRDVNEGFGSSTGGRPVAPAVYNTSPDDGYGSSAGSGSGFGAQ